MAVALDAITLGCYLAILAIVVWKAIWHYHRSTVVRDIDERNAHHVRLILWVFLGALPVLMLVMRVAERLFGVDFFIE